MKPKLKMNTTAKFTNTYEIHRDLKKIFTLKGIDLTKVYIAGGSLLKSDSPNDIDIYCVDLATIKEVELALSIISSSTMKTELASSYMIDSYECPIQVIGILIGSPEEVIKQFDFEQNACYMRFSENTPFYTNTTNDLILCPLTKTPNTMLFRLTKMLGKGFTIKKSELIKLMRSVEKHYELTPDEWNLSKKDLGSFYEAK